MSDEFEIRDVSHWEVVNPEPLGRDAKLWIREPGAQPHTRERDWLFKPVIIPANGHRQGEDWSEKIVSELGALIGVPCAQVDLAIRGHVSGLISRNVVRDGWSLVLGSVLLGTVVEDYQEGQLRPPGRPGHSPRTIFEALKGCEAPSSCGGLDAAGMFAGHLVLDAWVGNQDRHDQNWGALRRASAAGGLRLAASYDHASSLGFNLLDSRRDALLRSGAVASWAEKEKAHRFEHDPDRPRHEIATLVDTAHHAVDLTGDATRGHWVEQLRTLDRADVEAIVTSVPGLSDLTATFILDLLAINRRRLLRDR